MSKKDDDAPSPWLQGVRGVKGVVPPGRRLAPKTQRRPTRWSASGVNGVTPPGTTPPNEGPSVDWAVRDAKRKDLAAKANKRALEAARRGMNAEIDPMRPVAGDTANPFADANDPTGFDVFIKEINLFVAEDRPDIHTARELAQLITQSRSPYEIVVGFALLSAITGTDDGLREQFARQLERGATVFFNLMHRFDKNVKVPRGIVIARVDPIFFDLPSSAYQVPYAFATHAFLQIAQMLERNEPAYDDRLHTFSTSLYDRFIAGRSLGDNSLERMFPWDPA